MVMFDLSRGSHNFFLMHMHAGMLALTHTRTHTHTHTHTHTQVSSVLCFLSSEQTSNLGSYTAQYNDTAIHSLPAILNALTAAILKKAGVSQTITTYNLPWPSSSRPKFDNGAFSSSLMVGLAFALMAPGFAIGVVQEIQVRRAWFSGSSPFG